MHSMILTVAAGLLAALGMLGHELPAQLVLVLVVCSVSVVGIPHGAADHILGRRLLTPLVGVAWAPIFFSVYLITATFVLLGWYTLPVATTVLFFLVSAWHFGIEDSDESESGARSALRAIACGGLVIWVPCITQGSTIASLLQLVSPLITPNDAATIVSAVVAISPWLALLVIADGFSEFRDELSIGQATIIQLFSTRTARYVALTTLFSVVDPLLSFGVYFCGWHSIRGLNSLRKEFGWSTTTTARKLTPLTLVTVALIAIGVAWPSALTVPERTIRWLFLGLSAIAVPHLLLEIIASWRVSDSYSATRTAAGATQ